MVDRDAAPNEAERVFLAGIDGDREPVGECSTLWDAATRIRFHRDGAGLPEDHRTATRLGEHELRAVLPGPIEHEIDRRSASPTRDDGSALDDLGAGGPRTGKRMAVH